MMAEQHTKLQPIQDNLLKKKQKYCIKTLQKN